MASARAGGENKTESPAEGQKGTDMATKSKAVTAEETVKKEEPEETTVKNEPEEIKDPWAEQIEMIVPRKPKGEEQFYYVCVNDRRYQIPANGQMQKMPKPIANVLKESLEADWQADEFADSIPNRDGSNPQMHSI